MMSLLGTMLTRGMLNCFSSYTKPLTGMLSLGEIGSRGFSDAATEANITSERKGQTLPVKYLKRGHNRHMAYSVMMGSSPTIVYCHGFQSDMRGAKPKALEQYSRDHGLGFLKFDYVGCGSSGGNIKDVTFTDWKNDILTVIDYITAGPLILVGSNLSVWLMLLAATERPHRIHSMVGISPTPDLPHSSDKPLTQQQLEKLQKDGFTNIERQGAEYTITKKFLDDAEKNKILNARSTLNIRCPIRLLQGMKDKVVSPQHSLKLSAVIQSADIHLVFNKSGDHHFRRQMDMMSLFEELGYLVHGSWDARNLSIVSWSKFAAYNKPEELLQYAATS